MGKNVDTNKNDLWTYRKKMGFSQKRVASCAGLRTGNSLSRYERGSKLPSLINALKLEIVYRTPVAFLFGKLYSKLRKDIRNREEKLKNKGV